MHFGWLNKVHWISFCIICNGTFYILHWISFCIIRYICCYVHVEFVLIYIASRHVYPYILIYFFAFAFLLLFSVSGQDEEGTRKLLWPPDPVFTLVALTTVLFTCLGYQSSLPVRGRGYVCCVCTVCVQCVYVFWGMKSEGSPTFWLVPHYCPQYFPLVPLSSFPGVSPSHIVVLLLVHLIYTLVIPCLNIIF